MRKGNGDELCGVDGEYSTFSLLSGFWDESGKTVICRDLAFHFC